MLDVADVVVLNKYEKRGSEDDWAIVNRYVAIVTSLMADDELLWLPIASQFADAGVDRLWGKVAKLVGFKSSKPTDSMDERKGVILQRVHYL